MHGFIETRHLARESQQKSKGVLRDADGIAAGRAHDQHASPGGLIEIDVVDANPGAAYHPKSRRLIHQFRGNLGRASNDQSVRVGKLSVDGLFSGQHNVPPSLLFEQLDSPLTDLVGNNDFHRPSFEVIS